MKLARLLVCGVLVVGFGACSAPSPEKVCDHMADLRKKAKGEPKDAEKRQKRCLKKLGAIKEKLGDESWKKFSKCVIGKDDYKAAKKECDPDKS